MFNSFNVDQNNKDRKPSQFQGIVKNMNENAELYNQVNDKCSSNFENNKLKNKGSTMNDLKLNIQKAREKFNQKREESESIFKSSSQILERDDKKVINEKNNLTIQEHLKNHHEKK